MSTLVDLPVRVAVLGPVLVLGPGGSGLVEPPSARGKALVATLALAGGESVSVPRLVDELWGDTPPRAGKAALQTLVSRLRQSCADDVIVSTPSGYALGSGGASDLGVASTALVEARNSLRHDPAEAERAASSALGLWRGDPGADLAEVESAADLASAAGRLRSDLLRVRAAARCAIGDSTGCLADLDALGDAAHHDDELVAFRLRALDGAGRRSEALRVFAEFRERLADELGADPSPELVRLHAELLQDPAPRASISRLTIGLRQAPNALIGRDDDIERLEELLVESRLVTILGPGGLGKTRLAQELGRRAAETTPGVVVVELAGVRAEDDVALAFATTLGIREAKVGRLRLADAGSRVDVRELILAALSERPTLLIVDNCEHVIDAAATWVADILASTTNVRVLATSRSPLAIGAERVHSLGSLGSTSADPFGVGAAVTLFRERAQAARPGVALPADVVARLCERLDGLPLAIELAAARVRSMPVDEIERRLGNRFALLTGGDRSAPERHRTLTAVIDWSWNLLGSDERVLLRRLSRFPDGFGAEAAQVVGGDPATDVTDALDGLVTQSLVAVTEDAASGAMRYRMLETVREFGDRELIAADEAETVREAMFRWAEGFCRAAMTRLDGSEQLAAFTAMALEQDNLATILRSALAASRADTCVVVFGALGYFWSLRGNQTDVASFGAAVLAVIADYEADDDHLVALALTLALAGSIGLFSDHRVSHPALSRLRKLRERRGIPDGRLRAMTDVLFAAIAGPGELRAILPAIAVSTDPAIAEIGTILTAQMCENSGRVAEGVRHAESAYAISSRNGHVWAAATSASLLAQLHAQSGSPEIALDWAFKARDGLEAIGARTDLQELQRRIAAAEISLGRFDNARVMFEGILRGDEDVPAIDREDVRLVAADGLAEIAHREGREAESLARYDAAMSELRQGPGGWDLRRWPQLVISGAAALAAHALREEVPASPAETDALANSLRVRVIAMRRLRAGFDDTPVVGAAAFAIGAWLLWPARGASDEILQRGLTLVTLAARLGTRQEFGSLELPPVLAALEERFGADALRTACAEAAAFSPEDGFAHVHELLADPALRSPFGGL